MAVSPRENCLSWEGYKIIDSNVEDPQEARCVVCVGHHGRYGPLLEKIFSLEEDYLFVEDCSDKPREQLWLTQIDDFASKDIKHIQGWDHPKAEEWSQKIKKLLKIARRQKEEIPEMIKKLSSKSRTERKEAVAYLANIDRQNSEEPIDIDELVSIVNAPSKFQNAISSLDQKLNRNIFFRPNRFIIQVFPARQQSLIETILPHINQKHKSFIFAGGKHVMEEGNLQCLIEEVDKLKKVLQLTSYCIFQESDERM
ncbi:MAG: hypothetical protein WAM28_01755 [Chlamydiales bacterium]